MEFAPKASQSARGQHPDIDPDSGELLDDVFSTPNAAQRDHNRRWNDIYEPSYRDNYMERLTSYQRSLPESVQRFVQNRNYSSVDEYRAAIDTAMTVEGVVRGASVLLTDVDIERMSLQEFDHYFDEHGQPRPGVRVHYQRGQILDDTRP